MSLTESGKKKVLELITEAEAKGALPCVELFFPAKAMIEGIEFEKGVDQDRYGASGLDERSKQSTE